MIHYQEKKSRENRNREKKKKNIIDYKTQLTQYTRVSIYTRVSY